MIGLHFSERHPIQETRSSQGVRNSCDAFDTCPSGLFSPLLTPLARNRISESKSLKNRMLCVSSSRRSNYLMIES